METRTRQPRLGNNSLPCVFYAEFQRLALEAGMSDDNDTLIILLEQALSSELKAQIVTAEPPTKSADAFASFVQGLENRRLYLMGPTTSRQPAMTPPSRNQIVTTLRSAVQSAPPTTLPASTPAAGDPIDLSAQRRLTSTGTRKERGECFRCGSTGHMVKDCPYPDTRPKPDNHRVQARLAITAGQTTSTPDPQTRGRAAIRSAYPHSPSSSVGSGNGARLA